MLNMDQVLKYGTHTVRIGDLNAEGVAYLMQYGFTQSLQDSIAGLAKKVKSDPEKFAKALTVDTPSDDAGVDALAEMVEDDKLADRTSKILSGTIGLPSGVPRLVGDDKIADGIAREWLRAKAAEAKVKLPAADTDEYATFVAAMLEQNRDAIMAEVASRKASKATVSLPTGLVKA